MLRSIDFSTHTLAVANIANAMAICGSVVAASLLAIRVHGILQIAVFRILEIPIRCLVIALPIVVHFEKTPCCIHQHFLLAWSRVSLFVSRLFD